MSRVLIKTGYRIQYARTFMRGGLVSDFTFVLVIHCSMTLVTSGIVIQAFNKPTWLIIICTPYDTWNRFLILKELCNTYIPTEYNCFYALLAYETKKQSDRFLYDYKIYEVRETVE